MKTYKKIRRLYVDEKGEFKYGSFIAQGEWANGHLAYSLLDDEGNVIEDEQCEYYQVRDKELHILYMERV